MQREGARILSANAPKEGPGARLTLVGLLHGRSKALMSRCRCSAMIEIDARKPPAFALPTKGGVG
jgi:hypothetical protein